MANEIIKSTCRGCHGVCGVLLHIKNGKLVKVTGDPDSPVSRGYLCVKGKSAPELLYHPDRLKYPLKRAGNRGENKWQRISWNEAFNIVCDKLNNAKRDFGAESIVGARGTGRPYYVMFHRFLNCLGTPNRLGFAHLCYGPRLTASAMTCGELPICDYYGFGSIKPKLVLIWGSNLPEVGAADGMCSFQLTQTLKDGAKLIVVDPRMTMLAARANYWLQIRPGADAALALGMIHVIIKEKLYDDRFVEKWTTGFDELAKKVDEYPPEIVSQITWIPADLITSAARSYATTHPACLQWGVGIDQGVNSFQTIRALLILSGITGNIDVPGGDTFWVPPSGVVMPSPRVNPDIELPNKVLPELRQKRIGGNKYKLSSTIQPREFIDAVLTEKPYPIKALFIMGSNLLIGHSDCLRMVQALRKIDFIVAADLFMTPTTQFADIILPAASWLETNDVCDMHMVWCLTPRIKVATIGECKDDKEIIFEIAHRMGMEESFPWHNTLEYCDWLLKDSGLTFREFQKIGILKGDMQYRKYEKHGFKTPSGKFELYCSDLKDLGYEPLPGYIEPPESPYSTPELYKEYSLIITTGARIQAFFHSEGRQIKSLRRLNPEPLVEIHPMTAGSLNIKNGDWVWIESPRGGRIKQKARLTESVHPNVISAQHGWWFPEKEPWDYGLTESNINMITHGMPVDPQTGSESWRAFLCKVSKV